MINNVSFALPAVPVKVSVSGKNAGLILVFLGMGILLAGLGMLSE